MLDIAFITSTLDKYGLAHLDAKKVLLKMGGRRPGKRCKNGWIAAEKQCSDHKTADGKLTDAGKNSARELADKVRTRKGLTANGGDKKKGDGFKHVEGLSDLKEQWGAPLKQAIALSKKYSEIATIDDAINGVEGTLTALKSAISSGQKTFKAKVSGPEMETSRWSIETLSAALDKNNQERAQIVKAKGLDPDFKPSRMIDNISIIDSIKKESKRKGAITGAVFKDGKMESAYVASVNSTSPSLSLDYLASNPSNFMGQKTSKGAGKQAILELIEVSKKLGKGGSINLVPLDGAIGFYTKLGFKPGSNGLLLSSEDAAKLQSTSRRRSDSTNDHESNEFYLVSKDLNMDVDFVTATLDKYGLAHLDAKKVLLKMGGRRPGKHCVGKAGGKGSYISAEKQCAGHKGTDGKLTQAGKDSARELAARVRDRKGMGTQMATKVARMPMRDFIADIKGKPTEKIIAPMMRKIHKEARSELDKRRMKGGRSAIVDKKAPRTPKSASDHPEYKDLKGPQIKAAKLLAKDILSDPQKEKTVAAALREHAGRAQQESLSPEQRQASMDLHGIYSTAFAIVDKKRIAKMKYSNRSDSTDRAIRYTSRIRRSSKDSTPRFDSTEITRYTRAIERLNDRYGWHLDAQKVLSKLGKKLGKKCGGGWIAPEKKCKSHYTDGKLNAAGKASGENLADRIRQRKSLSTVSRNGKGQELSYAFMPGNQKQSTMTARRTHAPKSGYQTPGRLSNLSSTEERRSMVGLGQHPGIKSKPDNAPIMDLNPADRTKAKRHQTDTPKILKDISPATASKKSELFAYRRPEELAKIEDRALVENWQDSALVRQMAFRSPAFSEKATRDQMRVAKQFGGEDYRKKLWTEIQKRGIESDADNYQLASLTRSKPDNAPIMDLPTKPAPTPIEAQTRKMNANPSAGDRIRAVAQTLKDQDKIQKGATVGVLKVAEKLYTNQNNLIDEVSTMVNKDLDRAAAKGGKKTFEPTQPQSDPVAKASGDAPTGEPQTRKMNTAVVGSGAGDRLRAIAGKLKDEESVQKGATVGVLKAAEKLYVNQHKMIGEVAGMVNEDLDRAAAKGVRKIFDPAKTPVSIPNQRSSKAPRSIGRSVD